MKKLLPALCLFAVLTGCGYATKEQVSNLERDMRETRRVADEALQKADQAQKMAQDAEETSRRTEEMLNRSFRKSMRK